MENIKIMETCEKFEAAMKEAKTLMWRRMNEEEDTSAMDFAAFGCLIRTTSAALDVIKAQSMALHELNRKVDILLNK